MIENVIHINRQEFDRLFLLTKRKGYIAQTFNIATQDKFPLHKIHYTFENINPGEIYDVETTIEAHIGHHVFRMVVYYRSKCVGIISVTMKDFDPVNIDWGTSFRVKAIQKNRESWLKEVGMMTVTISMAVAYSILNAEEIFVENKGNHRIAGESHSDSDEIIYKKLKAYMKVSRPAGKSTGKGHAPQHEFDIRGFERHYKSGKVIWVEGFTKCKGRGTKIIHEYVTGGENN